MTDLIATLEGMTAPSREVDALIMGACFEWAKPEPPYLAPHCIGDQPIYWHAPEPYYKRPVPELTASLDATVALCERVLPGWTGFVDFGGGTPSIANLVGPPKEEGEDFEGNPVEVRDDAQGEGSTPAIALLIAILTALEARDAS